MRLLPELDLAHVHEAAATAAGARTLALARESGLFLSHFEHCAPLELPDAWAPVDRPDLGEVRPWEGGVLAETKFRHFRLDRMVGSFHPAQRSAWTAHELAHKLVGWAWWPGIRRLELAACARVAEALPVALWYFFDEAGRRRCAQHAEVDAWGALYCRACEAAALLGPRPGDEHDAARIAAGWRFLERELEGAAQSLAQGRPVPTPWRRVDLCSDGLAWTSAHAARLGDPRTQAWLQAFIPPGHGHHASFAALVARVRAVAAAIVDGAPLTPWRGHTADWVLQDTAARVVQVAALVGGDAGQALDEALQAAAADRSVRTLAEAYASVAEDYELPEARDVFAVGYAVPGVPLPAPSSAHQAALSGFPQAMRLLGAAAAPAVQAFRDEDDWARRPFVRRFEACLRRRGVDPRVQAIAAVEAAVADAPPADLDALALAPDVDLDGPLVLGRGQAVALPRGWRRALEGGDFGRGAAATVVVQRAADQAPALVELSEAAAALVRGEGPPTAVPWAERRLLVDLGVLVAP